MIGSFLAGVAAAGCSGAAVVVALSRRWRHERRSMRASLAAAQSALAESAHVHDRTAAAAQLSLSTSAELQTLILDSLDEGVALHDPEFGVIAANRAANEMLRITPGPQTMPQQIRRTFDVFEPDGRPIDPEDTPSKRALRTGEPQKARILRYQHHDGHSAWMRIDSYPIAASATSPRPRVLMAFADITARLEIERQLETERQLLHAMINSMHVGVLAVESSGKIVAVNQAFHDLAGTAFDSGAELSTFTDLYTLIGPDGNVLRRHERPLTRALGGETVVDEPITLQQADGRRVQVLVSASPTSDGVDRTGAVLTLHDVTQLRAVEAVLRELATTDTLTALPNRRSVLDRLGQALLRQHRQNHRVSVLFIDLDAFKAVNDNLGHEAGDELLVAAAGRITTVVRPCDFVGRHGGDEFVIIAEDIDPGDAHGLAMRLEAALSQPFLLTAGVARVGGSVGVAHAEHGSTPDSLLAVADAAMYRAKRRHRIQ